jgi:phosphate transport system substrate-binding protein
MKTALRLVVGALALAVMSTGMASVSDASATTPTITANSTGIIQGGGASFPNDQYQAWITAITNASPNLGFGSNSASKLNITYRKKSSGEGKAAFVGSTDASKYANGVLPSYSTAPRTVSQMFSGTDSLVSSGDKSTFNNTLGGNPITGRDAWTQIPMTAGPIAVITNVPGVSANIKLDGATICKIYTGEIKKWNDTAITTLNPTVTALKTINQNIVPVARDATSGTTFIFVSFLATAAGNTTHRCSYKSDWLNTMSSLNTPTGSLAPADAVMATRFAKLREANDATVSIASRTGNDGVRDYVNTTSYSIGYVEMAYSFASNIRQAAIKRADSGATYLLPTQSGANAALAAQNALAIAAAPSGASPDAAVYGVNNPVNPGSSYIQPVNQAGSSTYPIVGYSWILLYLKFDGTIANAPTKGQVEGLVYFFNWALTKGAVFSIGTTKCYSPLPTSVKSLVIDELKKVQFSTNGSTYATVWR